MQPEPTRPQPPPWETRDYVNVAVSVTGKVFQYGVLKPLEIIGDLATELENYLYPQSQSSTSLEDKEITPEPDNTKIPGNLSLKTMQGGKFELDKDAKVTDLKRQVRELKRQLREAQGIDGDSDSNVDVDADSSVGDDADSSIDVDFFETRGYQYRNKYQNTNFFDQYKHTVLY